MSEFARSLSVSGDLEEAVNEEARATAFTLLRDVVIATPVDEGRARGNWQVGTAGYKGGEVSTLDIAGGQTINKGKKDIDSAKAITYPTIYITNNLPYIGRLNDGWSQQAPKKFVDSAVKRAAKR